MIRVKPGDPCPFCYRPLPQKLVKRGLSLPQRLMLIHDEETVRTRKADAKARRQRAMKRRAAEHAKVIAEIEKRAAE